MTGVGGKGPRVEYDAVVEAQFKTETGLTEPFTISVGVVPDGTFPGDLTLGKGVFHQWQLLCHKDGNISLEQYPNNPKLLRINHSNTNIITEMAFTTHLTVHWHKKTPLDNPLITEYLLKYPMRYPGIFDQTQRQGNTRLQTVHHIDTEGHQPVKLPPRRYSPRQEEALREFVQAHEGKLIRKSKSPWASPSLLTPKKAPGQTTKPNKNDTNVVWRFCCDYRELNKRTKKNAHPLPNAMDEIQKASGHKWYHFIDLKDGFWHIPIHPPDQEKTAFATPFGLYEWTVMPFGLCNAPATFQSLMEEILLPLRAFVSGLLDDISIWGDTIEQLDERTNLLFQRFEKYGMMINSRKSQMFVNKGVFLGFIISEKGIEVDPDKVAAIRDRPKPETTTDIRGFVNAAGYFRSLIKNYSLESSALTDLSGGPKKSKIKLTEAAEAAWKRIRDLITSTPIVRPFDWKRPCVLETDSSKAHVGAALLQPHLHGERSALHPIAYFSKKLDATQGRYSAQERELLAVMLSLQHWRHWVEGGDVTVITDHESLKTINNKTEQPARILRFLDAIEHYGVRLLYRPGKANVLADYLSRPPEEKETSLPGTEIRTVRHPHELSRYDLQAVFEYLHHNAPLPLAINEDWCRKHFAIIDNSLVKITKHERAPGNAPHGGGTATSTRTVQQVVEPHELLERLREIHKQQGHASIGVMLRDINKELWHPEITLLAQQAVIECQSCQLMKKPDPLLPDLQPIQPPIPLTRWAMDHTSIAGISILVAIEYATGWVEAAVVPSTDFPGTIPLLTKIGHTFGFPKEYISDNAGAFTSAEAVDWHRRNGTIIKPVTPARPRGNGKVEKANGDIKRTMLREHQADPTSRSFPQLLQRAVTILNRTPKQDGYSSFFLLFGTQPPQENLEFTEYAREAQHDEEIEFRRHLATNHEAPLARSQHGSSRASRNRIRAYLQEKKGLIRTFAPGDWVLRVRQRASKHEPYYDGPWAIISCHSGNTYRIRSPGGIELPSKYNGTNLFPAYMDDGHPVRSLWYGSKRLLEQDRQRLEDRINMG